MKLIHASLAQAPALKPGELPVAKPNATIATTDRREAPEASAFWPELHPKASQALIDKGYGEELDIMRQMHAELADTAAAMGKGWAVPEALKTRAVFEVAKVLTGANAPKLKLNAAAILERMVRASQAPNALPDQIKPEGGPAVAVQVNVTNNGGTSDPSVSVAELVDEILGRADVQAALDAEVPDPGYDYGM